MNGGKKLAEGGYGCVFHPEIDCKGTETTNMKYVSKLQKKDFSSNNEVKIGEILKERFQKTNNDGPLYNNFAPVLSSCPINIKNIKTQDINECSVITKDNVDTSNFVLMKIRFIDMKDFDSYIIDNSSANLIVMTLIRGYNHLLDSINLLIGSNITHLDLKGSNIVFDNVKTLPIIIDFGLSIPMNDLNSETMYNYFYIYAPEYYVWPVEVHYINLLLHITSEPTDTLLKDLATRYTRNNNALTSFSEGFRKQYIDLIYSLLKRYNNIPFKERIKYLIRGWTTWDNYSLSILYLKFLYFLTKSQKNKALDNNFVKFMSQLLLKNIHPNFKRRLSVTDTKKAFDEYIGNADKKNLDSIEQVINVINKNKKQINKNILINSRKIRSLTENTVQRLV